MTDTTTVKDDTMDTKQQIEIYQTAEGQTEIEVRLEQDTVWLSQAQMAELFGRDRRWSRAISATPCRIRR